MKPEFGAEQPQLVVVPGGGARYLPAYYNGQQILWRSPWEMSGDLVLSGGAPQVFVAFQPATFQNSTDKPFEIHDYKVANAQSAVDGDFLPIAEPAPGLHHFWRMTLKATGLNEEITAIDTVAAALFDWVTQSGQGVWPWYMPFCLEQTQGFQGRVASQLPTNRLRVSWVFRGYLLTLGNAIQRGGQPG